MNGTAQLDNDMHADEDENMNTAIETHRDETSAGFREVNARIDALNRDTSAKIDTLNRDTSAKIDTSNRDTSAKIDALNRETSARIDALWRETNARIDALRDHSDTHFRWLVGMMLTMILGTGGLILKVYG